MRIPRDVDGSQLATLLGKHFGYRITRQTGSHLRLTTTQKGPHHVTIPVGGALRIGTLASILAAVGAHLELTRDEVVRELFG